jgi:hypothetical protein
MLIAGVLARLLSSAGALHRAGGAGHDCVHDQASAGARVAGAALAPRTPRDVRTRDGCCSQIMHSMRSSWRARGLQDPYSVSHVTHEVPMPVGGRRLQSYSRLRIKVMLDLLEDGV